MKQILKPLYSCWIWIKEIFGFVNLGTIHAVDIVNTDTEEKSEY